MRLANLPSRTIFDQAGHLQLFNVMRENCGAHAVGSLQPWRTASVLGTLQFP
jgi:hypothetical protein